MRRTTFRAALWPTVAALVAALGACTGDGGASPSPSEQTPGEPSPGEPTVAPETFAEPPDGAEVVVSETGFSESPRTTGDTRADLLSWGVVIENTSDEFAAWDLVVAVHLLDADGNQIDEFGGEPTDEPAERKQVTRVLPGDRVGFGNTVPHYGTDVADLAVEVEVEFWQPVGDSYWWYYPITATEVTTRAAADEATLSFAVDAAYTSDTIRGQLRVAGNFAAIFRDSDGAVVGGAGCCHRGNVAAEIPPGRSTAELILEYGMPADADETRTEVYLPDPREQLPG